MDDLKTIRILHWKSKSIMHIICWDVVAKDTRTNLSKTSGQVTQLKRIENGRMRNMKKNKREGERER